MQNTVLRLLTARQAADYLNNTVTPALLKRLAQRGGIRAVKPGNRWLFPVEALEGLRLGETEQPKTERLVAATAWVNGKRKEGAR